MAAFMKLIQIQVPPAWSFFSQFFCVNSFLFFFYIIFLWEQIVTGQCKNILDPILSGEWGD